MKYLTDFETYGYTQEARVSQEINKIEQLIECLIEAKKEGFDLFGSPSVALFRPLTYKECKNMVDKEYAKTIEELKEKFQVK